VPCRFIWILCIWWGVRTCSRCMIDDCHWTNVTCFSWTWNRYELSTAPWLWWSYDWGFRIPDEQNGYRIKEATTKELKIIVLSVSVLSSFPVSSRCADHTTTMSPVLLFVFFHGSAFIQNRTASHRNLIPLRSKSYCFWIVFLRQYCFWFVTWQNSLKVKV
jgi:hypothetical protein